MTPRIASKYRPMTRRSDSGSSFSPSAVEPVTSAKITVTVLRVSARAVAAPAVPHAEQNLAS